MKYRVKLAFEYYRVGDIIEPTGLWRDSLLARGYIEPAPQEAAAQGQAPAVKQEPRITEQQPKRKRRDVAAGLPNQGQQNGASSPL